MIDDSDVESTYLFEVCSPIFALAQFILIILLPRKVRQTAEGAVFAVRMYGLADAGTRQSVSSPRETYYLE